MNDDIGLRLLVVAAVGISAVAGALIARRGTGLIRRSIEIPGFGPGLVFFSSSTCASCARMRERLRPWRNVVEVTYETAAGDFPSAIDRVPALCLLDGAGRGWVAYGVVSEARLARWVGAGP
ncbi:MAG: hypothetical protein WD990_06635 [Acidimicrobiia bacterium]